jgi:hypothetical protein
VNKRQEDRRQAVEANGISGAPTHLFRDWSDIAAAIGRTRSDYLGLARQDAPDAARDAGLETRMLDLPMLGGVLWRGDLRDDRLNFVVEEGTVIRAAVFDRPRAYPGISRPRFCVVTSHEPAGKGRTARAIWCRPVSISRPVVLPVPPAIRLPMSSGGRCSRSGVTTIDGLVRRKLVRKGSE